MRRPAFRRAALYALFMLGPMVLARPALAHALLTASIPAANGHVAAGTVHIVLHYNDRVDRSRSRISITGPGQADPQLPIGKTGPADVMAATATLAPGRYVLHWLALSVDGHITQGDVPFTVTAGQ